eukprot:1457369-Prymnesium_polylepis.1
MFTARVASEPGGTKCATARKNWCAAPNVFHVHTPAHPTRTPECNGDPRGITPARERWIRSDATSRRSPGET